MNSHLAHFKQQLTFNSLIDVKNQEGWQLENMYVSASLVSKLNKYKDQRL